MRLQKINFAIMEEKALIPDEVVMTKIYVIRGQKVMMDRDLAELYGVETKYLKRQVRRNEKRFPEDFMFQMTKEELTNWRSQFVTSNSDKMGLRYPPMVFTEQGVAMLSGVLNSDRAITVNIQIMRIFCRMRQLIASHQELIDRLDQIEQKLEGHDHEIVLLFEYLKKLMEEKEQQIEHESRKRIGFNKDDK